MNYISYIVVALIPSVAVLVVIYLFLKKFNDKEKIAFGMQLKSERQKFFLSPRVDAYQRLVLLLERINPNSLILRLKLVNKNATLFHAELLDNIRNEFDHNVAQQIFISNTSWEMVKNSKEETVKIINLAAQQLKPDATAYDLSTKIFEIVAEIGELPTDIAIKALKKEFQTLF